MFFFRVGIVPRVTTSIVAQCKRGKDADDAVAAHVTSRVRVVVGVSKAVKAAE